MKDDGADQSISFATGGFDHIIRMWQPNSGRYMRGFDHNDSQVNSLSFTTDGLYLVAAGFSKIRIYNVAGGTSPLTVLSEFTKNVNSVGHNAKGNLMFAGGEDKIAKVFDLRTSTNNTHCVTGTCQSSSGINSMVLHPNQTEIFFCNDKGEIYIWDLRNGEVNVIFPDSRAGPIHSIAINTEGTSLAAVNNSGNIIVWSLAGSMAFKLTEKLNYKVHSSYAMKCEFSPDSTLLGTCGADGKINLLKTADYSVMGVLEAQSQSSQPNITASITNSRNYWVWDCAFSADSRYLLSAHSDGIARLWNLEDCAANVVVNKPGLEYKGHQKAITCLAFRDQSLGNTVN